VRSSAAPEWTSGCAPRLAAGERVRLALALGERDLETFRRARGLDPAEAGRRLDRQCQRGRRPSACARALAG
jgi:hypothetical protein